MFLSEFKNGNKDKSSQSSLSRTLISIALRSSSMHSIIAFNTAASDNITYLTRLKD
nr:MAG TPA: hypothetical protein [Caudoviricetes sp.]